MVKSLMSFIPLLKEAKIVVDTCFRAEQGDTVTVLADSGHRASAEAIAAAAHLIDSQPIILDVTSLASVAEIHSEMSAEPPQHVRAAMTNSDIVVINVDLEYAHRLAHTEAVRMSCENNARIASLEEGMGSWGLTREGIETIEERTVKLIGVMKGAKTVKITAPGGTDVRLSLEGRPSLKCTPIKNKGEMMNPIPLWGEVAWAPVEDSAEGRIVIDGFMCGIGLMDSLANPIEWMMKRGRAVEIRGDAQADKLKAVLSKSDENASGLGEFAIGTSHYESFGSPSEQGKLGTVHFALGDNLSYPKGRNRSKTHFDGTVREVTVEVDGHLVVERGKIVARAHARMV